MIRICNRKQNRLDKKTLESWQKGRRKSIGKNDFGCLLYGRLFQEGDVIRWIYANDENSPFRHGNFFVCSNCDDTDEQCLIKAASLVQTINPVLAARL